MSNYENLLEEKKEEPTSKRARHSDRLALPRRLAMELGYQKGLVFAWSRLSRKGNRSCTENDIEKESEWWLNYKKNGSETSATRRATEKTKEQKEGVVSNGEESDDRLDANTIRHYRESK